ncbi:MAG: hypothetical protein WC977_12475, partial [Anaerovoracaceae bacterium]
MSKYDDLIREHQNREELENQKLSIAINGMQEILMDQCRVADLYANADKALLEIDERFQMTTGLDRTDIAFLMLATSLQIGRWVVLAKINRDLFETIEDSRVAHDDKGIVEMEREKRKAYQQKHGDEHVKGRHRDWTNIVFDSVPYDITKGSPLFGVNMEGGLHRVHTLGHDPILGWIFGTMNILSDTITLEDFRTFNVCMDKGKKRWTGQTTFATGFAEAIDSIKEDQNRFPAAVFAQALHLKSDVYTKLGLPVPFIETFSPELAGNLYKEGYDSLRLAKDIGIIGSQAAIAVFINILISCIHGLFHNPEKHVSRDLYEVKTRKILSISNVIASSSNVIWVGGNAWMGNEQAIKDLDIGGLAVTMYRLFTDIKFISRVKEEYLINEWNKQVVGDNYKFVTEAQLMSKKDVDKGIEIQAKAHAAKERKVADGLKQHATILMDIESGQKEMHKAVGNVLKDMKAIEAKLLYGIETDKTPLDLGENEKLALCAALYSLLESSTETSEAQKQFYLNFEQYIGVSNRVEGFDYSNLSNIDSHADRMLVLDVLCTYLFLGKEDFSFIDGENYKWLKEFALDKDIEYLCSVIEKEYDIVGVDGIVTRYKTVEIIGPEEDSAVEEEVVIEEVTENPHNSYEQLSRIVTSYVVDEAAFGKNMGKSARAGFGNIRRTFPRIDPSTFISLSKVGNGYLMFTTYAFYLKTGTSLKEKYVRVPYADIKIDSLSMGLGKAKGTRKLIVHFGEDNQTIVIDDSKIEEEKLRDLIREITVSGCAVASSDFTIHMFEMSELEQVSYFKALGNILHRCNYGFAELYLIMDDYGLSDKWNEIAATFGDNNLFQKNIDTFFEGIPYPSFANISQQAVALAIQTAFRTNHLEGRETATLTDEMEKFIKLFDRVGMSQKTFNEVVDVTSKSKRNYSMDTVYYLQQRLYQDTLFTDSIKAGAEVMSKEIQ